MIYFNLANGDITKVKELKTIEYKAAYKWFYFMRVESINKILASME
jgi:hypothetical protein